MGVHNFLLYLKVEMAILNSQSFNSFLIFCSCFCLIFVKVDIVLVLVDLCRIMGVVVLALNNGKIGTQEGCKLDFSSNLPNEITPCNLLFHLFVLRVFLLMQVLLAPSLLLFFCKFFLFFFYKKGLKEIQPPS